MSDKTPPQWPIAESPNELTIPPPPPPTTSYPTGELTGWQILSLVLFGAAMAATVIFVNQGN